MKALTLIQPWATLVAIGAKRYETRSWSTRYRGPLAITASKGFAGEFRELCGEALFRTALYAGGHLGASTLPLGAVVCTCRLVNVHRVEDIRDALSIQERAFGCYEDGRFAWELADVHALVTPIPCKGNRLLWEWEGGAL